ncbi:MAG: hypothetical protein D6819_00430, partial [Gammaproteobacteria bacterium]
MVTELEALEAVDFDWTLRQDNVWREDLPDVPELHRLIRKDILRQILRLGSDEDYTPLGRAILGPAGSGKTHLIAALRRALPPQANFVMVDLAAVTDFWETVRFGFVGSMQRPLKGNRPQFHTWLETLLEKAGHSDPARERQRLAGLDRKALMEATTGILSALHSIHPQPTLAYRDILRALFLLNSEDFALQELGDAWLQGWPVEEEELRAFRLTRHPPLHMIQGLSWIAGLHGPTLLALDQLDDIVTRHHLLGEEEGPSAQAARAIVQGLGAGLGDLVDHAHRTLVVVTCLESSWDILQKGSLAPHLHRFEPPDILSAPDREAVVKLVEARLAAGFRKVGFIPPFPTWPFSREALEGLAGLRPRIVLRRCRAHQKACLERGEVTVLERFEREETPAPPPGDLEGAFQQLRRQADVSALLAEENEDALGGLLHHACRCLILEGSIQAALDAP